MYTTLLLLTFFNFVILMLKELSSVLNIFLFGRIFSLISEGENKLISIRTIIAQGFKQ